jgi:hypothetical protein
MGKDLTHLPLNEVAKTMAETQPSSMNDQAAQAEFLRRQTMAIQETASATRKYTLYMLISVVLLLISVAGSLVFSYLDYIKTK